jgi:hypothetical protein
MIQSASHGATTIHRCRSRPLRLHGLTAHGLHLFLLHHLCTALCTATRLRHPAVLSRPADARVVQTPAPHEAERLNEDAREDTQRSSSRMTSQWGYPMEHCRHCTPGTLGWDNRAVERKFRAQYLIIKNVYCNEKDGKR